MTCRTPTIRAVAVVLAALVLVTASPSGNGRKFYDDDPLVREPETENASGVHEWDIDLFYDLAENLFGRPGDPGPAGRARNVNTIDEVPDSSWFTNRVLARPLSIEEVVRGPLTGAGHLVGGPAQERGVRAGLHDARRERRFVVRLVRREGVSRGGDRRDSGRE